VGSEVPPHAAAARGSRTLFPLLGRTPPPWRWPRDKASVIVVVPAAPATTLRIGHATLIARAHHGAAARASSRRGDRRGAEGSRRADHPFGVMPAPGHSLILPTTHAERKGQPEVAA
jgi:hypothetical protein